MNPPVVRAVMGCRGKLPGFPDFVNAGAGGRDVEAFEAWIQAGLYALRKIFGADWEPLLGANLCHRFTFRAENSTATLVGILRGSQDSRGRYYPFTTFILLPTVFLDQHPVWLPQLCDALFSELERRAGRLIGFNRFDGIAEEVSCPFLLPVVLSTAQTRYDAFLDETFCYELEEEALGGGLLLLEQLATTTASHGQSGRRLLPTLSLPLGASSYVHGLELRFWIELTLLLVRCHPASLTLSLPSPVARRVRPRVLLSLRQPGERILEALVREDSYGQSVWRPGQDALPTGVASRSRELLGLEPTASLRALLSRLQPGYPGTCPWFAAM